MMGTYRVAHTDPFLQPLPPSEEEHLRQAGCDLVARDCRTAAEVVALAAEADGILVANAPLSREAIESLKRCRVISRFGVGLDNVDVAAATDRGIVVANVPDFCTEEVSNHTLAFLLAAASDLFPLDRSVRAGRWDPKASQPVRRLTGKVLGLVGFGRIGNAVARKALSLGMKVLVYDPYIGDAEIAECSDELVCELDALLERSDYVSLHAPLTEETRHMIGAEQLRRMKPSAILINCARGAVVDEMALIQALEEGVIAGACLDVLEKEPPDPDNPLLRMDNVILTPHSAAYSDEAMEEVCHKAVRAVIDVLTGGWPESVVNPEVAGGAVSNQLRAFGAMTNDKMTE